MAELDPSRNPFTKRGVSDLTSDGLDRRKNPFTKKSTNPADYPNKTSTIMNLWSKDSDPKQEIDSNTGWGEVLKTSLSNIPSSSFRLLRDVVNAATSPIDTAKAIFDKEGEGFNSIVNHMKNRYTTEDGFKKAVALDPVGVLSDLSMVVMPAGGALKQAGKMGSKVNNLSKAGKVMENVGDTVAKTGAHMDPLTYPGKMASAAIKRGNKGAYPGYVTKPTDLIKRGIEKIPGGGLATSAIGGLLDARDPRKMMENNLKMKGLSPEQIQKMLDLAMEKELYPTATSGNILEELIKAEEAKVPLEVAKADKKQNVINDAIRSKEAEIPGVLAQRSPSKVINTKDFEQFIPENTVDTRFADDLAVQKETLNNFTDRDGYKVKQVTAEEAKAISDDLNTHFEEVPKGQTRNPNDHPTKVNTLDALRRGVAQTLYNAVPELKGINQNLEEFIALKNALTEATNMTTKETLQSAVSIAQSAALGGPKAGMAGLMKGIFSTPKVKVAYAALMNKLEKMGKRVNPAKQNVGQGLVLPERAKDNDNIQPDIQPDIGEN